MKNLEYFRALITKGEAPAAGDSRITYPPPIARTLGMQLVDVGEATSTVEMVTRPEAHANPMGTIHGGVLVDLADLAIGTAHWTTLEEGESFTTVDLQINFFRPIWEEKIRAVVKPVNRGRTFSRYVCDVLKADGKLIAQVTSTVTTLRGDGAKGR
ncbi:PaaI family thioesterase [Hyalangium versicolor]|uniref:PaaI family thioesterase n=1 Tax=Hyalangium versicolor TaxID=2861190 RepID=UPI001CCF1C0C|nr:PaaI family thioesterase [Hyalangium versicolor]